MRHFTYLGMELLLAIVLFASCSSGYNSDIDYSLMPVEQGDKWGYINTKGEYVINLQFDGAYCFSDGLANVQVDGKVGFIDKSGKYVISPQYSNATDFYEGRAWVVKPMGAPELINTKGRSLFTLKNARNVYNYSEGLAVVVDDNERSWVIDKDGKKVFDLPEGMSFESNFSDGLAAVQNKDWKYGYVDKKGKIVINCQFDAAGFFLDGKAIVKSGDMYGVIDKSGKYGINPQFAKMRADGDRYVIKMGDSYGWCDEKGKIIINPQFKWVLPFYHSDLAVVAMGKQLGYVDKSGKIEINPQFESAVVFMDKIAWVQSNGKWGLIDKEGKFVANPQFDNVRIPDRLVMPTRERVTSEFFDIEGIVSWAKKMLDGNKVDGMEVSQTSIKEFRDKYGLNGKSTSLEKEYSRDLSYTLEAHGTFYEMVSDGWWGQTAVDKPTAKINYMTLHLQVKENKNTRPLYDALLNALGGNDVKRTSGQRIKMSAGPGYITIYASDGSLPRVDTGWSN